LILLTEKKVFHPFSNTCNDIIKFEVWFQTPYGLFKELADAIVRVEENDFDANLNVRPVSVAITETGYEVCGT